jgi:DNA-binding NtrC family response regulator
VSTPRNPTSNETAPISTSTEQAIARVIAPKRHALLIVYHRDGSEIVPLARDASVVVGREAPADIAIPDRCLSRRHAKFTLVADEEVAVEDLGSTNGTRIGGAQIERASLRPGEEARLGTVVVAFHVRSGVDAPLLGLEGEDVFHGAVEAEINRAKFFNRSFAVLVVRSSDRSSGGLPRWYPSVRALLRPVDRAARYSAEAVEILLPEVDREQALAMSRAIVEPREGEPGLLCGVALFPGAAASAEEMLGVAWESARGADAEARVRVASTESTRVIEPAIDARAAAEGDIVAESPAMRPVVETTIRLARAAIPVFLHGETGSGKEVLARLLHEAGPRRGKPLVCVNCGAIPPTLVESTLFGHERGAFTGAVQHRGIFEAADGGTVFLDEIGDLPAPAQAALLRVLESKRITRVGSTKEIPVDVRIVVATHRDLEAMCTTGGFRSDLYYRLSAMVVEIPPLRARREDIAPLARRFLALANRGNERPVRGIDAEALALLERYAFPGNVRELYNAVERAVVIAEGDIITARDLPVRMRAAAPPAPDPSPSIAPPPQRAGSLKERVDRVEAEIIVEALREAGWSQTEAARRLDVPLRTLQHKIKTLGIKKLGYSPSGAGEP